MIFRKKAIVPDETSGGLPTVAVRMPNHPIALALIRAAGGYIAAPSANTSGRPSPTRAEHVMEDLDGRIDMVIDGGEVRIGLESTIVDFTGDVPCILRPGYVNEQKLREILGEVTIDPAIITPDGVSDLKPRAPGMAYRHYAPKARLSIVTGDKEAVITKINELAGRDALLGKKVGVIATDETAMRYTGGHVRDIGSIESDKEIAQHLFSVLRDFDDDGVDIIYSEAFDTPRMGQAIMNRLLKAAGHSVIEA
jgi:L-threonylcarbamoyladenylate synthase